MKKLAKKTALNLGAETIRSLSIAGQSLVSGASVSTCPPTIGLACSTLRSCIGHATCLC